MLQNITDPRSFFESLVHEHGERAKPEYLFFRPGETILRQGEHVRRLLLMRNGEVELRIGGRVVSTYIADRERRNDASAIISASDYCYSTPSSYDAVALIETEILAIDTRILKDMGLRGTIFVLLRNMLLFSDMGPAIRRMIADEFDRTGLVCFGPDVPEELILRHHPEAFEEYYLDFAMRAMAELMAGRVYRAREDLRSTAIVALPRPSFPLTQFKSF